MERNAAIDWLRLALAVMVVALHGHFLTEIHQGAAYFLKNFVFRIAVPLFFLISGYYFRAAMNRPEAGWRKWMVRVLTLYAVWTLIYILPIIAKGPKQAVLHLAIGYWHLWYLLAMAEAGVLLYACRNWSSRALAVTLAALYGVGLAMQYLGNYHAFGGPVDDALNYLPLYRNALFFAFPMMGLGYLLADPAIKQRISLRAAWILAGGGALSMLVEHQVNLAANIDHQEAFDLLASIPLLCAGLFLVAERAQVRGARAGLDLAALAAAIYFVHPLMLKGISSLGVHSPTPLVAATIVGSAAAYLVIGKVNRRWPIFL